jgi:hypothetical protein
MTLRSSLVALALLPLATSYGQTPAAMPGATVQVSAPQQAWQARRAATLAALTGAGKRDPEAIKALRAIVAQHEARPLDTTPMENADLLGALYVPRDGVEATLPAVVSNLVLGWYDALRFTSKSGQAEIVDNEEFFTRAYRLGGADVIGKAAAFIRENPEKVRTLVAQGIALAEKARPACAYDPHWPSAYGMERMMGALGGDGSLKEVPAAQWDQAWEAAKVRVRTFFGLSESGGSESSKYFPEPKAMALADAIAAGDVPTVDKLVAAGAAVNQAGTAGMTPLIWALLKGQREVFEDLLDRKANPNAQLTETVGPIGAGSSAVSLAAMHRDIEFLRDVLRHGGDANLVNAARSQSPLGASLSVLRTENAKLLIASGVHLDWQDRNGDTAAILAASTNQYELVYLMLQAGADPTLTDRFGATLLTRMNKGRTPMDSPQGQWKLKVYTLLATKGIGNGKPPAP